MLLTEQGAVQAGQNAVQLQYWTDQPDSPQRTQELAYWSSMLQLTQCEAMSASVQFDLLRTGIIGPNDNAVVRLVLHVCGLLLVVVLK